MTNPRIAEMVLESAIDYAILTSDLSGNVTSWSIGAENIFGWTEDEVLGLAADIIFTSDDRAQRCPAQGNGQCPLKTVGQLTSAGICARMDQDFGPAVK